MNLCLNELQKNNEESYNLVVYSCNRDDVAIAQFFSLTDKGALRNEKNCAFIQTR